MQLLVNLIFAALLFAGFARADSCSIGHTEPQDGVQEAILGNVRVKFESFNKLAKMKMIGQTGSEDWTSVETGELYSQITGFEGNGDTARLIYQLIVKQNDQGLMWVLFKLEKRTETGGTGTVYFANKNKAQCRKVSLLRWTQLVSEIFKGKIEQAAAIYLDRDEL